MDALPVEVREELARMPPATMADDATALARGLARNGLHVLQASIQRGREAEMRQVAATVAAASIRLVEYCNQDWP